MTEEQFNKLLDEYRSNQLQFLSTQRPEYKKAAQIAQSAIEDALSAKQETVSQQRRDMTHFTKSYSEGTKELFTLVDKADNMHKDAQTLMDSYETSKNRYDMWSEKPAPGSVIDYANGYGILWRVGVLMVLFPFVVLLGFYSPQLYQFASSYVGYSPSNPVPQPGRSWFG